MYQETITKETKESKGSFLWNFSKKFQFAADRYIPDSFVFCLILSIVIFGFGMLSGSTPVELIDGWYSQVWAMNGFAFQMSLMVMVCGAAAKSPLISSALEKVALKIKSRTAAIVVLLVFGLASSVINWSFSLILTPILAMYLSRSVKGLHFPLLIAAGYSTMLLGQSWCPSASAYALLAGSDHFLVDKVGVIPQSETTYNPVNTILFFILAAVTIAITLMTRAPDSEIISYNGDIKVGKEEAEPDETPADKMNNNRFIMYFLGAIGLFVVGQSIFTKGFLNSLNFNFVIFMFLILNVFLYSTPVKFTKAFGDSIKSAAPVMLQFPFYSGIMGLMMASGLATDMANYLIQSATPATMPLFSYLSASIVNLFIPSQGGQWIIQGPILIEAAQSVGAHVPTVVNAFIFGDEATNLIQPLYVIPALALIGMKLKDVWGFMAFIWFIWTVITSIGLLVLPQII
ncbi:MAG: short-chain fatty acid transporter [Vibrio sp.]|uniref:short-chain fatty acid transporter n=1 Tax=Vibrio sp. TaxID=678 RepID=UPI003A868A8A